jgi:uncharacterized protein YvpB
MKTRSTLPVLIALLLCIQLVLPGMSVRADDLPVKASIPGFTGHHQEHNLTCEISAAVDLAGFWGVQTSEAEFLDGFPLSENPDKGFVGGLDDIWGYVPPYSYGVHAEPVANRLEQLGLKAQARRGMTMDELKAEIVAGRPVLIWVIGAMWYGSARQVTVNDDETVTVAPYEHAMVLTGYDESTVTVFDPAHGISEYFYRTYFDASWAVLGNMAVTVSGKMKAEAAPTPSIHADAALLVPVGTEKYTVQVGDNLISLGEKYGKGWRWIVQANHLPYPWTLFPGQEIIVK